MVMLTVSEIQPVCRNFYNFRVSPAATVSGDDKDSPCMGWRRLPAAVAIPGKEVRPLLGRQEPRNAGRCARAPWGLQDRIGGWSMAPFVSPTIAVVSAIVAVVSLLLYIHSSRRSDKDSARDEALALAGVRAQVIAELRAALEQARMETHDNLTAVRCELEESPPDVDGALRRIRRLLERESRSAAPQS